MADSSRAWAVALSLLCLTSPLAAQTTGRIQGTVTDNSGAAVPGVAVSVSSSSLQGVHSTITDSKGEFRFASVPPGSYSVRLELAGFKTVTQSERRRRNRPHGLAPLQVEVAALSETVSVMGESPVIDTSSSSTGVNATADLFNRLPVPPRLLRDRARWRRGCRRTTSVPSFYGSTSAENQYIIDGLNTTGIELGHQGQDPELRLRPGDRGQDGRPARGVRPHDGRRASTSSPSPAATCSRATSSGSSKAAACRATTPPRPSGPPRPRRSPTSTAAATTAPTWAAISSRTSSGSSAPTTGRAAPTTTR